VQEAEGFAVPVNDAQLGPDIDLQAGEWVFHWIHHKHQSLAYSKFEVDRLVRWQDGEDCVECNHFILFVRIPETRRLSGQYFFRTFEAMHRPAM
jgi:hypothetical protein